MFRLCVYLNCYVFLCFVTSFCTNAVTAPPCCNPEAINLCRQVCQSPFPFLYVGVVFDLLDSRSVTPLQGRLAVLSPMTIKVRPPRTSPGDRRHSLCDTTRLTWCARPAGGTVQKLTVDTYTSNYQDGLLPIPEELLCLICWWWSCTLVGTSSLLLRVGDRKSVV